MADITKTFKAVKRVFKAAAAAAMESGQFAAAGIPVECAHCHGKKFNESPNLGGGVNLVCKKCHLVHWFAKAPSAL